MKEGTPRTIVSRRNRPAKAALSRDVIVAKALEVLERDGFSGFNLRRVAAALDTGPASLYVYLENLDELQALMLDSALAAVNLPKGQDLEWRSELKAFLLSYFRVLYERPGVAQIALSTIPTGPNSLRILELLLGLLAEGGVENAKAAWGADLLLLYVTAIAAEQSNWRAQKMVFERVKAALDNASKEEFPLIAAHHDTLISGGHDRADWALEVIINGMLFGGKQP